MSRTTVNRNNIDYCIKKYMRGIEKERNIEGISTRIICKRLIVMKTQGNVWVSIIVISIAANLAGVDSLVHRHSTYFILS